MEDLNVRRLPDDWDAEDVDLLQAIDDATATLVYISYGLSEEWLQGLNAVLDRVEDRIARQPALALLLIEHAIVRLDGAVSGIDDSDGGIVEACSRLETMHASAADIGGLTPHELAARIDRLSGLELRPFDFD